MLGSKMVLLLTISYSNCKVEHERLAAASTAKQDQRV
jgi:hypothetical protein